MHHRKSKIHSVYLGDKFGMWTVIGRERFVMPYGYIVRCRCLCGTERDVIVRNLTTGKSKSCGCGVVYNSPKAIIELWKIWQEIRNDSSGWSNWETFLLWSLRTGFKIGATLKHKYHTLYTPSNCFWRPKRRPRSPWKTKR